MSKVKIKPDIKDEGEIKNLIKDELARVETELVYFRNRIMELEERRHGLFNLLWEILHTEKEIKKC